MINKYIQYTNENEKVINWVNTVLKNYLVKNKENQSEIEHTLDYLACDKAPKRIDRMSYKEALINTGKWVKALNKKGSNLEDSDKDIGLAFSYDDGYFIAELKTENAFKREGTLMHHCLGGYTQKKDYKIYSLRDEKNNPHATFEVLSNDNEINQIKGKGNGSIHPKYVHKVLDFLEFIGQKIRPSEMKNLGYHHIPKDYMPTVLMVEGARDSLTTIAGETYAYEAS